MYLFYKPQILKDLLQISSIKTVILLVKINPCYVFFNQLGGKSYGKIKY